MEKIAKRLTDLIGNTPLLELNQYGSKHDLPARIIAKLEYFNPAGSVKDRIALAMIDDAEKKGLLNRAASSSSRPAATPESAWRSSPPFANTG